MSEAKLRDELKQALEEALEIERRREADTNARIVRYCEDVRALDIISAETGARIRNLEADLTRLQLGKEAARGE